VAWIVLLYHALLGAVAHLWWYAAVERVGASRAAIFMNVTPLVGIGLAAALLGEPIGPWQIGGVALVLAGVGLTTTTKTVSGATRTGGDMGGSSRPPHAS
jgi:drug/metabolite transporter (DMT)-like permease